MAICFICNTSCVAIDKYVGLNIVDTLKMPLSAVLQNCLRVVSDVEEEYFCIECTEKIKEYDRLMWQSRCIEKELLEKFQNKCIKFDVDEESQENNEIIWDRDRVNEVLIETPREHNVIEIDSKLNIETFNLNVKQENEDTHRTDQRPVSDSSTSKKIKNCKNKSHPNLKNKSNEEYSLKSPIEKSKKLHYTIENFSCDYCGRTYRLKGSLSRHIVKHIGKSPHECKICEKTFTQGSGLSRHMRIHKGVAVHQCDVCGKRFIHSQSFNMHKKIHVDERSKRCTICGSTFRSSSHLTRHMRTHTGEKPFVCSTCGQRFAASYNLRKHHEIHKRDTQNEPLKNYKCLVCPQTFISREKLNKHLVQAHQAIETSIPLNGFYVA